MSDPCKDFLLFFDRPTEPILMDKGNTRFILPDDYYPEEYKDLKALSLPAPTGRSRSVQPQMFRSGDDPLDNILPASLPVHERIDVKKISIPDISLAKELPMDEHFSFFVPKHSQMATQLIDIFMSIPSLEELMSIFAYCQLHINPYLFNYCVSVTLLHRPDTRGMDIPTFADTFPDKFVDRKSLRKAREHCALFPEGYVRNDYHIDLYSVISLGLLKLYDHLRDIYRGKVVEGAPDISAQFIHHVHGKTGSSFHNLTTIPTVKVEFPEPKTAEHHLAYFREDVGLNSHHWHWHLIYPNVATNTIVNKDRRGELFYYMHHQIMARYNTERMCNGLQRTKPYENFREPIPDGYFPLLDSSNASRAWMPRFDNLTVNNVNRLETKITISNMEKWRDRILEAVETQTIQKADGSQLQLDEETGIDILGNIIESSSMSINPNYYGSYHNNGHMLIAYVHDPEETHSQQYSVMGDSATAMRDPIFYRWHACIDDIFTIYKDNLRPYGSDKLVFPDISVSSIDIEGVSGRNTIKTLWERSSMNLKNALDFLTPKDVFVEITHLQHEEFNYVIEVNNTGNGPQVGTVRIFMAPIVDEGGKPLSFDEQRKLMIEMDKFSHTLSPGHNTIRRSSVNSSVTIPFERIFRDYSKNAPENPISSFCDCGWPQNLLVPKGNTGGYSVVMFVMVSNWNDDKVERALTGAENDNASYCGLRDQKYPDRRAMGFPFDRKAAPGIDSLGKFLQQNMAFQNCTIKFTNHTRSRGEKSDQPEGEHHDSTSSQRPSYSGPGDAQYNPHDNTGGCQRPSHSGPGDAQCNPHDNAGGCQQPSHSGPGDAQCNPHDNARGCHRPSHSRPGDAQCNPRDNARGCHRPSHFGPGDAQGNPRDNDRGCHRPSHFGPGDSQYNPRDNARRCQRPNHSGPCGTQCDPYNTTRPHHHGGPHNHHHHQHRHH